MTLSAKSGESRPSSWMRCSRRTSWNRRLPTAKLNDWLCFHGRCTSALPAVGGRRLKIQYMTQANARPPTFVAFVAAQGCRDSYVRYLVNGLEGPSTCQAFRSFQPAQGPISTAEGAVVMGGETIFDTWKAHALEHVLPALLERSLERGWRAAVRTATPSASKRSTRCSGPIATTAFYRTARRATARPSCSRSISPRAMPTPTMPRCASWWTALRSTMRHRIRVWFTSSMATTTAPWRARARLGPLRRHKGTRSAIGSRTKKGGGNRRREPNLDFDTGGAQHVEHGEVSSDGQCNGGGEAYVEIEPRSQQDRQADKQHERGQHKPEDSSG